MGKHLGYAEEATLRLLRERGPLTAREVAKARGVTERPAWTCLSRLRYRGLVRIAVPHQGGRGGHQAGWALPESETPEPAPPSRKAVEEEGP